MADTPGLRGRAAELRVLADAVGASAGGQPSVVVVSGDAGIGKSRLLREALSRLDPSAVVGSGAAVGALGATLPYGLWVPVIEDLLTAEDPDPVVACRSLGVDPDALASVLPDLPGGDEASPGARVVPALVRVVRTCAARRPVVVVLDDVHWADEASLGVLVQLVSLLRTERLCVLVGTRTAGSDTSPRLAEALDRLLRAPRAVQVTLGGLGDGEAAGLLEALGVPAEHRAALLRRAGGNPFLLAQLGSEPGAGLPGPARRLVAASLESLSHEARLAVALVATAAGPLPDRLMDDALAELGVTDGPSARDDAVRAAALRRAGDRLGLRHVLVGEAVLDGLEVGVARSVSAALLDGSNRAGMAWAAADLARFAAAAGRQEQALQYNVRAARNAREVFALADAARHLHEARDLWIRVHGTDGAPADPELWLLSIRNSLDDQRPEEATRLIEELAAQPDDELQAWLVVLRAQGLIMRGYPDAAYEQAAAALPGLTAPQRRLEAIWTLARSAAYASRALADQDLVAEADALAEDLGDTTSAARAASVHYSSAKSPDDLLRNGNRAAELFLRAGDLEHYLESVSMTSVAHYLLGHDLESVEVILSAFAECEGAAPERVRQGWLRVQAAEILLWRGHWQQARRLLQPQPGSPRVVGSSEYRGQVLALLDLYQHQDRPTIPAPDDSLWSQMWVIVALEAAFWAHDTEARIAATQQPSHPATHEVFGPRLAWLHARALAETGQAADPPEAPQSQAAEQAGLTLLAQAERRRATGTDTPEEWLAAATELDSVPRPYESTYARWRAAARLLATGRTDQATQPLRDAYAAAAGLPFPALMQRLEALARRARINPTPVASPDTITDTGVLAGLTPREHDVLRLVAAGRTNSEIADELFITTKTASVHVSNILRKLNVPTRQAAAAVHDQHTPP
jgi:DNA-binding CsgD family transcriptional regulator